METPTKKLNAHAHMPIIGLGTWQLKGQEAVDSIQHALEVGYRHIDTATIYGNQVEVGQAVQDSKVDRSDVFITSKVWQSDLAPEDVRSSIQKSLSELQTDYIDLILIHWPDNSVPVIETLIAMEEARQAGQVKAVGVSNFNKSYLEMTLAEVEKSEHTIEITNNQIEIHPTYNRKGLIQYSQNNDIVVTAYTPLGEGKDLEKLVLKEIAEELNATPAQVTLAWHRSKGIVAIPKSSNADRIEENFKSLDLELTKDHINRIDRLHEDNRLVNA